MRSLSHRKRIESTITGKTTDRPPVALWRHFPVDDQDPFHLAAAAQNFQATYDFDLIKLTPASSFCLKDWGSKDEWRGNPEGTRDYTAFPIQSPEDWLRLPILSPQQGHLAKQLECVQIMLRNNAPQTPVLQTVFSPLAQAKNLAGKDTLLVHLRQFPDALHQGLQRITETTISFIQAIVQLGCDGIFYAIQHAQAQLLSAQEFNTFGRTYDLQVLQAAQPLWLNLAHIHGSNIFFNQIVDYPVAILNWHDRQTSPSLAQAQQQFSGTVCGGIRQWETLVLGTAEQVQAEAIHAIQQTNGQRFILGTGCVLPITAPHGNILAARKAVENLH
jgi:uroporphyrinogen decarboxylase